MSSPRVNRIAAALPLTVPVYDVADTECQDIKCCVTFAAINQFSGFHDFVTSDAVHYVLANPARGRLRIDCVHNWCDSFEKDTFIYLDDVYDYARPQEEPLRFLAIYILATSITLKNHLLLDARRFLTAVREYLI